MVGQMEIKARITLTCGFAGLAVVVAYPLPEPSVKTLLSWISFAETATSTQATARITASIINVVVCTHCVSVTPFVRTRECQLRVTEQHTLSDEMSFGPSLDWIQTRDYRRVDSVDS